MLSAYDSVINYVPPASLLLLSLAALLLVTCSSSQPPIGVFFSSTSIRRLLRHTTFLALVVGASATGTTDAARAALQPLCATFGLTVVAAAVTSMMATASVLASATDVEGEMNCGRHTPSSNQEGVCTPSSSTPTYVPSVPLQTDTPSTNRMSMPPGLHITPSQPLVPISPAGHTTPQRPRSNRQTARSRAHSERCERRMNAAAAVSPRLWLAFLRAAHFCFALRRRVHHRRAVLSRCMLLMHPVCSRFIKRLRASRRLTALELISRPPCPMPFDVGYDAATDHFTFRDTYGRVSGRHPAASRAEPQVCIHIYALDGTIATPLSPPPDSPIVLCPEASGGLCYYDTSLGDATWFPPNGSSPLVARTLHAASACLPSRLPPQLSPEVQLNGLRFTGWVSFFQDAANTVQLMHIATGAVRDAPWIALRTTGGIVYFANLVTRQTRWLPPHRWMEGFTARRPCSSVFHEDWHPCAQLDENRAYDPRSPLLGMRGRQCVEGGAPYFHEGGIPQYPPDQYDSPLTYPLKGFVSMRVRDDEMVWVHSPELLQETPGLVGYLVSDHVSVATVLASTTRTGQMTHRTHPLYPPT